MTPLDQNDLDDLDLLSGVVGPIRNNKRGGNPYLIFSIRRGSFDVLSLLIRIGSKRVKYPKKYLAMPPRRRQKRLQTQSVYDDCVVAEQYSAFLVQNRDHLAEFVQRNTLSRRNAIAGFVKLAEVSPVILVRKVLQERFQIKSLLGS